MKYMRMSFVSLTILLIACVAGAGDFYQVSNVQKDDFLALRAKPDVKSNTIARIPFNPLDVFASGQKKKVEKSTWVEVYYGSHKGWVNNAYLIPSKGTSFKERLDCVFTEPYYSIDCHSGRLILKDIDEHPTAFVLTKVSPSKSHNNKWVLAGSSSRDGRIFLFVEKAECGDDMSDVTYAYKIVMHAPDIGLTLSGCANPIVA